MIKIEALLVQQTDKTIRTFFQRHTVGKQNQILI